MTDERYVEKALMTFVSFLLFGFAILFSYSWTHFQQKKVDYSEKLQKEYKVFIASFFQPATLLVLVQEEYMVGKNSTTPEVIGLSSQLDGWTQSNPPPKCERLAAA